MEIPQKYFHDKPVLALLSANLFLSLLAVVIIFLRLSSNPADVFTVQYRENLGLNAYKSGGIVEMLSFGIFAIMIFAITTILSIRTYDIKRQLALVALAMCTLLLILTLIVSNALLVLQ